MNPLRFLSHPLFVPFAVQSVLAYEWLSAGWEKIQGGEFVPAIGKTLLRFENGNPHEWYVGSVLRIVKKYPTSFGALVQWGELLVGIGLGVSLVLYAFGIWPWSKTIAGLMAVLALLGGVFMNLNFYFAAGWTGVSTGGLNALMFWVEVVLLIAWVTKSLSR